MSTQWNQSGGTVFESAPTGIHEAVCIRIIDLGTQESEYKGEKTIRRQNLMTWELPEELRDDGQPFIISKFYTASLGEKSNLYKDLTSWLGKSPVVPFDPQSLLGKGCQLIIVDRNDKNVVNTVAASKAKTKKPHNPTVFFSLDDFNEDVFNELSSGIQKIIMRSPEYAAVVAGGPVTTQEDVNDDDPPF